LKYFIRRSGVESDPLTKRELELLVMLGKIGADTEVRSEDSEEWVAVDSFPLVSHLIGPARVSKANATSGDPLSMRTDLDEVAKTKDIETDIETHKVLQRFSYLLSEYRSQRSRIEDSMNGVAGALYKMPSTLLKPYDQLVDELVSGAPRFEVSPIVKLDATIQWKDRLQGFAIVAALLGGAWMLYRAGEQYNLVWLQVAGVLIGGPLAIIPIFMVGALISALMNSALLPGPAPSEIVSELHAIRLKILGLKPSPAAILEAAIPEEHVAIVARLMRLR
jgi:hypothetical protein